MVGQEAAAAAQRGAIEALERERADSHDACDELKRMLAVMKTTTKELRSIKIFELMHGNQFD